jgi:hypothetical protein
VSETDLAGQDLRQRDMRHADLRGKALFGTDLRGANLYGADIRLECCTFDGVKLDALNVALLLRLIALADLPDDWSSHITHLVEARIGKTQNAALSRYLQTHVKA